MNIFLKSILILILLFYVDCTHAQIDGKLIFPLQKEHVHGSSIVALPNGDLLSCWFQGSGERNANDVGIMGARLKKGKIKWSKPFLMADTPRHPDCNPVLFLNRKNKLFLVWIVVQANQWETSILKFRTSLDYKKVGAPNWNWQDNILLKPDDFFAKEIAAKFKENPGIEMAWAEYAPEYEKMIIKASKDKKKRETGWMTRIHPLILENGKILLPLYSDGFNISITAISNDDGINWHCSLPMVGKGNIQPSFIRKNDGTIVAFMRDSGDAPGRVMISTSTDEGKSWSFATDSDLPNPGASIEVLRLNSGNWLLIYNDVEDGRYSLAAAISDDEGVTWKWKNHLENTTGESFHYPSVIQADDGKIHVTYSYFLKEDKKSIKHVSFFEAWVKE